LVFLVASFLLAFPGDPLLSHSCYMSRPSYPPRLDYSNYTWRRAQITKIFIIQFSPLSSPHPCLVQISSSAPSSQTTSVSETKFLTHTELQATL
jgi:hypothetical protein